MKIEQEIIESVFDAYIKDIKAVNEKHEPTIDMLEEVKNRAIKALGQETILKATYDREHFARKEAEQKFWDLKRNCIEIPKDASNGDMIKAMFPFSVASLNLMEHSVCLKTNDGNKSYHNFVWWNSPYERGAEND